VAPSDVKAADRMRKQACFLQEITAGATITAAVQKAGFNRRTLYRWRDSDTVFAEAWEKAETQCVTNISLEDEAMRRAVKGVQKPVYRAGEVVGHVTDYSDSMLMFLLKAHHPEKYGAGTANPKAGGKGILGNKASSASHGLDAAKNSFDIEGARDALFRKFAAAAQSKQTT